MKIIIPMAGRGTRMRPHTLTIPKPLIPIAGKAMVEHIVEDLVKVCSEKVDEVAYVIGDFGKEVEQQLIDVAEKIGAKGSIYYQEEPLGTAHAILCAADALNGKVLIAFADTLFRAEFKLEEEKDAIIWVHQVNDPSQFGVVKMDGETISDFVEKPEEFISNMAIIGIYYFRDGDNLKAELQYLIDNDIRKGKEFQLTDGLENMKNKGVQFYPGTVQEWLDCGNKDATVHTNQRILEFKKEQATVRETLESVDSTIVEPCSIGNNVHLENATIGPHVSIGDNTTIQNSVIQNCIIQSNSVITNAKLTNSMIGNFVEYEGSGNQQQVSIGDYSSINKDD
jgi:glucose-1-phosphate thymidylyltransferase